MVLAVPTRKVSEKDNDLPRSEQPKEELSLVTVSQDPLHSTTLGCLDPSKPTSYSRTFMKNLLPAQVLNCRIKVDLVFCPQS